MSKFEQDFQRALQYFHAGQLDKAQAAGQKLLKRNPGNPGLLQFLGEIAWRQGKNRLAEDYLRRAVASNPDDPQGHYRLANVLATSRRIDDAVRHYRQSVRLQPDYWQANMNLGSMLLAEGRLVEARECYERTLEHRPDLTQVSCYLLDLRLALGELSAVNSMSASVHSLIRRCIDSDEHDFSALMYLAPLLSVSRQDYLALSQKMDELLSKPVTSALHAHAPKGGKLRIGYLSPDFGDHPISHVTLGVFGQHDRERFEVIAYSMRDRTGNADQAYIKKIRQSCDDFVDLSGMTVRQAAQRVVDDGVGILVNLAGYMSPPSLEILSWRPAPVQVYWLGHGGGLGLSFINYMIADAMVIPTGAEGGYREKVVRLPDSYHCADTPPISESEQSRADHGLDDDAFVFCAFNNPNKIDSGVFDAWMNILRRVPGSQIWLSSPGNSADLKRNLRAEAQQRGINPDRLVFAKRVPDKSMHFARHRLADLFLDTFVYNASTTAIDALWAGLPVLTRPGNDFVSRICATHVANVGLGDMICSSTQEFEDRAVFFASDSASLAMFRDRLARNRLSAPLFDNPRFVRHLESAYLEMWRRHLSDEGAESFDVVPIE